MAPKLSACVSSSKLSEKILSPSGNKTHKNEPTK